ncbi:hypothetical protein OG689_09755 [Kitasatospora sp. NBC_00240]|uniref:hypothetical protein n=1 Tax=Kitasatospora sp. NBC_00240 TaxID=2903567 RepID=UPI002254A0A6|nr:hypothetical protein [Kitasatospora sp. NBC_00240]MCX5209566.1 hypothetical protein [Kitasatospora sp. NBC_00240]
MPPEPAAAAPVITAEATAVRDAATGLGPDVGRVLSVVLLHECAMRAINRDDRAGPPGHAGPRPPLPAPSVIAG